MWMMPLHLHVNQKSDYDDMTQVIHWKQIKLRKYAYSSKTLLINTLNSGSVNLRPNRIHQSKSMHIMPRGHIVTDPSTFSFFITLA